MSLLRSQFQLMVPLSQATVGALKAVPVLVKTHSLVRNWPSVCPLL
ncbi:hypothetical protein ACFC09_44070 [Streptomyces sp. NPDC056161]